MARRSCTSELAADGNTAYVRFLREVLQSAEGHPFEYLRYLMRVARRHREAAQDIDWVSAAKVDALCIQLARLDVFTVDESPHGAALWGAVPGGPRQAWRAYWKDLDRLCDWIGVTRPPDHARCQLIMWFGDCEVVMD
jgi:hypothetical protein